jgi:hypothetical protein
VAGTRVLTEWTYKSGVTPNIYYFTIVVDQNDLVSVRNMKTPFGLIIDSMTSLPESVISDINTAIAQVESIMSSTSAVNGTLVYANETSKSVVFATALSSATYRVQTTADVFVPLRITSKTTTGFTVEAAAAFTGNVGYDVFI